MIQSLIQSTEASLQPSNRRSHLFILRSQPTPTFQTITLEMDLLQLPQFHLPERLNQKQCSELLFLSFNLSRQELPSVSFFCLIFPSRLSFSQANLFQSVSCTFSLRTTFFHRIFRDTFFLVEPASCQSHSRVFRTNRLAAKRNSIIL